MSVVSNASPLVGLARLGHLELLHALYRDVLVPEAVWQELVVQGAGQPGAVELERAPWIRRCAVANQVLVQSLRQQLGAGEAEAIALALEAGAELLLMDERLGRDAARRLGVRAIGVAGVLLEAKRKRLIPAIKPYLDLLRDVVAFVSGTMCTCRSSETQGKDSCRIAGKRLRKHYDLSKPQGVRGRNSDNTRLRQVLGWEPQVPLEVGLERTYRWVEEELRRAGRLPVADRVAR